MEQRFHLGFGHADPGVGDHEFHEVTTFFLDHRRGKADFAVIGEFAGVAEKIENALAQFEGIRRRGFNILGDVDEETIAAPLGGRANRVECFPDDGRHVKGVRFDFHSARFDLRQIENAVDQPQQMETGRLNFSDIRDRLFAAGAFKIFLDDFGVVDDRVERRPQLMAHIREKLRLGRVRRLGGVARADQVADEGFEALVPAFDLPKHCIEAVDETAKVLVK